MKVYSAINEKFFLRLRRRPNDHVRLCIHRHRRRRHHLPSRIFPG